MTLSNSPKQTDTAYNEAAIVIALAVAAAVLIKIPGLFGIDMDQNEGFYMRNFSLFVLPLLTGYFAWKRRLPTKTLSWLALAFVSAVLFANIYPFESGSDTQTLLTLHLPIALWLIVGVAYTGGNWSHVSNRMDFIRFSGELFIHYVLIALGSAVIMAIMVQIFHTIAIDIEPFFESWILPCGIVGAVIIASWLVEIKQGVAENLAPMLARLFSPLFTIVLITFLGTLMWTGRAMEVERNVLFAIDMLLVIVLGLLLYSISARDPETPAGFFDWIQVFLLMSALIADLLALWAISNRITELGFTPNRVVALGVNIILLVNLAWSTVLYIRFLRGRDSFSKLEKWQTDYLPVYAAWAAMVVIVIPSLFEYT